MSKKSKEYRNKQRETAQTTTADAPGVKKVEETTKKETAEVLKQTEKVKKDCEAVFGKYPNKEEVVKTFYENNPKVFGDKSYEEIMDILKNGIKDKEGNVDTALQNPPFYERLQKNVDKNPKKTEVEKIDNQETKKEENTSKEEVVSQNKEKTENTTNEKQEEKKEKTEEIKKTEVIEPKLIKETTRWKQEDEDSRGGSKKTTETTVTKSEEKQEIKEEKKTKERKGGFFKAIGKTVIRPFANVGKMAKTVGKTLRTPIGLTSYLLSDIGEKQNSGWKDRWAGYKKIWKGK